MKTSVLSGLLILTVFLIISCNDSVINPKLQGGDDNAKYIFFNYSNNDNPYGIYKYDIDSNKFTLIKDQAYLLMAPVNNKIYYMKPAIFSETIVDIYRADLDGKNEEFVTGFVTDTVYAYKISPNGTKIAKAMRFHYNNVTVDEIHISDIDGSNDEFVMQAPVEFSAFAPYFTFLPDNSSLQYIEYGFSEDKTVLYHVVKNGNNYVKDKITKDSTYIDPYSLINNISSDGKYLAFKTYNNNNNMLNIYNFQNQDLRTILTTTDPIWGAKLSPDGSKIAYWRNPGTFCVSNSDGTNEIILTHKIPNTTIVKNLSCAWSLDNKHIVFSINNEESSEVYMGNLNIADINTGTVTNLISDFNVSVAYFVK